MFTSRALSIIHRPVALCLSTNLANVVCEQPIHSATWLYKSPPSTIQRARWRLMLLRCPIGLFSWNVLLAFNVKNPDLIMTVKKVPKILWLGKFCNFSILHVHMHIMKITQYSCQTNSCFGDNFTIPYLSVEKVSHFYRRLKKSKF